MATIQPKGTPQISRFTPLFHGTGNWLKPNDTVDPSPSMYHEDDQAWASSGTRIPMNIARSRGNPNKDWQDIEKPTQLSMMSPVYRVYNDSEDAQVHTTSNDGEQSIASPSGYRVSKLEGLVNNLSKRPEWL